MTLFIVSLFLPYTVNFAKKEKQSKQTSRRSSRPSTEDVTGPPSLLDGFQSGKALPALTPGATVDHERIFLQGKQRGVVDGYPFPKDPYAIAPNEPHSPAWGKAVDLNHPASRAKSPPPSSILRHEKSRAQTASMLWKAQHKYKVQEDGDEADIQDDAYSEETWTIEPNPLGNGGLRNATRAACNEGIIGDKILVGTLGMPTDALDDTLKGSIAEKLEDDYESLTVFTSDSDFSGHYSHYCKTILWPTFHYQVPDNPRSKAYEDHSWVYYVKINQAFADIIAKNYKRGDVIWIHDYHLLLVPGMLRKVLPDAQIGFFLHIAFPSSEVFRCLAVRKELLEGILGANLIGFNSGEYVHHFLQTCSRILNVEATPHGIQLEDRFVNVGYYPIGIDPESLDERRSRPDVSEWIKLIQEKYHDKLLLVARDKLDNTRGVRQKLLAYELFLNKYPEWRDKVVLIQVATSTTDHVELAAVVGDIVQRVNSQHSTLAHQPLVFLKQDLPFAQYLALLIVAQALLITSLREGMNLTSHEFVYCQDGRYCDTKYGSLILSEFTGSASIFEGHDLLVNPWDYVECAESIKQALEMTMEKRKERWERLYCLTKKYNALNWVRSFLEHLNKAYHEHTAKDSMSVPRLSLTNLKKEYQSSSSRLFMLDYEGTLASWGSPSSIVLTTPKRATDVLTDLIEKGNLVYVTSARMPEEMERLFRRVPGLGMIAENGCYLQEAGSDDWLALVDPEQNKDWKEGVMLILKYYEERVEGSKIEERHCSLTFSYADSTDLLGASKQASECANHINDACACLGVRAIPIEKAVLVEPANMSKATAAEALWRSIEAKATTGGKVPDFIFVAGDDRDDEPVFRWANNLQAEGCVKSATTVTLAAKNTEASATLTQGVTGVISTLQKLASLG
ncbi:putativetrehalose phosphate synthase subunit [Phaeomoniella chlamydospora]|uniref:Putativetrehalose phosphate synthase subunit n=1 Tax=Phaeomoniella chlamydospora TaxID=158046 RepID=A0A0G2HI79_PHACM|nr:putativetrehalose phosphate synthase subunit [Phaeomoniella chlamydospora]